MTIRGSPSGLTAWAETLMGKECEHRITASKTLRLWFERLLPYRQEVVDAVVVRGYRGVENQPVRIVLHVQYHNLTDARQAMALINDIRLGDLIDEHIGETTWII
jgi:hypothetical protein